MTPAQIAALKTRQRAILKYAHLLELEDQEERLVVSRAQMQKVIDCEFYLTVAMDGPEIEEMYAVLHAAQPEEGEDHET